MHLYILSANIELELKKMFSSSRIAFKSIISHYFKNANAPRISDRVFLRYSGGCIFSLISHYY